MVAYRMALHKPVRGYRKDDALTAFIDLLLLAGAGLLVARSNAARDRARRRGRGAGVRRPAPGRVGLPAGGSVSPVPLADTTLFLAVCRDISERREIEQIKGSSSPR
jgi:hypothetical protein